MSRRLLCVAIAGLSCAATAALGAEVAGQRTAEFPMAEVPVVSLKGVYLSCGAWFEATQQRDGEVKAYPILKSAQPLYGEARFGEGWPGREEGRRLHFVVDESEGAGKGYDRLYLDLGGDLDLSDDRPAASTQRVLTTARGSKEVWLDFEVLVPVGDYCPENLRVRLGRLDFNVSNNRHADGRQRGAEGTRSTLAIRKDKPFVLDFSNKPAVLFTNPAKDARFKPGQEVDVRAVLIEPVLDLVIGGLADVSGAADAVTKGNEGASSGAAVRRLLHPTVVITDGSGRKVAEGAMPFG